MTELDYYGGLLVAAVTASGVVVGVQLWVVALAVQNAGRRVAAAVRGEPDPVNEKDEAV